MTPPPEKRILIVAGPNGAGKTTFAREFLPHEADCLTFVNADLIAGWRAAGYRVTLFFLSLPSPEMAISRVAERVRQGGHDVPEDIIRRRFFRGKEHFEALYKPIVNDWILYDNSGDEPALLEKGENP